MSDLFFIEYTQSEDAPFPFRIGSMVDAVRRNLENMLSGTRTEWNPVYVGTVEQCDAIMDRYISLCVEAIRSMRVPTDEELAHMSPDELKSMYDDLLNRKHLDARQIFGAFDADQT